MTHNSAHRSLGWKFWMDYFPPSKIILTHFPPKYTTFTQKLTLSTTFALLLLYSLCLSLDRQTLYNLSDITNWNYKLWLVIKTYFLIFDVLLSTHLGIWICRWLNLGLIRFWFRYSVSNLIEFQFKDFSLGIRIRVLYFNDLGFGWYMLDIYLLLICYVCLSCIYLIFYILCSIDLFFIFAYMCLKSEWVLC